MKNLLTIAGSDSSGGAGIQADIKTFISHGCDAMSVITSVTAQSTVGVYGIEDILPDMVKMQIDAVFSDMKVDGVKIGMVSNAENITIIANRLEQYRPKIVVFDPVMVSSSGKRLLNEDAIDVLKERLVPEVMLITPNINEAEVLAGIKIKNYEDIEIACRKIFELGAKMVLIKGGHSLDNEKCDDVLFDGERFTIFDGERIKKSMHGTGCRLSSAIAANLAKGENVEEAVRNAKEYVAGEIERNGRAKRNEE